MLSLGCNLSPFYLTQFALLLRSILICNNKSTIIRGMPLFICLFVFQFQFIYLRLLLERSDEEPSITC